MGVEAVEAIEDAVHMTIITITGPPSVPQGDWLRLPGRELNCSSGTRCPGC